MNINRILIVGLGSVGTRHLKYLRPIFPNADIRALTSKSLNKNKYGLNGTFIDIDKAVKFSPDFAVIASPSSNHIEISKKFAINNTHLFIEKPLSNKSENVEDFLNLCRKNRIKIQVGYNLRYSKSLKFFKKMLQDNILGPIFSIRCDVGQYLPNWRSGKNYSKSVSANKDLGGGVLLELSHELDYIRWIFGEIEWVIAHVDKLSDLNIDVEDTAHITLGIKKVNNIKHKILNLNMDFYRHDATRTCLVIGKNGSLKWDFIKGIVKKFDKNKNQWITLYEAKNEIDETYVHQWKDFINNMNSKTYSLTSGKDGLKVLKIIEAIKTSSYDLQSKKTFVEKII